MIRSRDDASTAEGFNTDTQPRRAELPFDKKKTKTYVAYIYGTRDSIYSIFYFYCRHKFSLRTPIYMRVRIYDLSNSAKREGAKREREYSVFDVLNVDA